MNTTTTTIPCVSITLSAANMGPESTEADFDAWASYVVVNINEALGIHATVDQDSFSGSNTITEDVVGCDDEDTAETVRGWLSHEGWDAFCSSSVAA